MTSKGNFRKGGKGFLRGVFGYFHFRCAWDRLASLHKHEHNRSNAFLGRHITSCCTFCCTWDSLPSPWKCMRLGRNSIGYVNIRQFGSSARYRMGLRQDAPLAPSSLAKSSTEHARQRRWKIQKWIFAQVSELIHCRNCLCLQTFVSLWYHAFQWFFNDFVLIFHR